MITAIRMVWGYMIVDDVPFGPAIDLFGPAVELHRTPDHPDDLLIVHGRTGRSLPKNWQFCRGVVS